MKKAGFQYISVMVAMCGLVGAAVGVCMGTAGLFYSFISKDLNLSSGSVSMMYTITALSAAFAGLLTPKVLKKPAMLKPLIITGTALTAAGTFLLSLAANIWMLYIFSVIRGIGSGLLSFVLATTLINNWFYARNGLMVSVAMAFSGLPGVLLSNVFTSYISASGWRSGYVLVTAVIIAFCLPAVLLPVKLKPEMAGLKPYGYEDYIKYREANRDKVVVQAGSGQLSFFSFEMISLLMFAILACIIASFLQHMPSFAVAVGMSAAVGASMSSMASMSNIVSKLMFGVLTDKIGPHKTTLLCAGINIVSIVILLFIHTPLVLAVAAFLFGFTFANSSTAMSMLTRGTFGIANYTRVYPLISFVGSSANALGVTLLGMLYDSTGTYTSVLLLCLVLQVLVVFFILGLMKTKKTASE